MYTTVVEPPRTKPKQRTWGDRSLLQAIKNPSRERYEIRIHCPEVTFIGKKEQPDFACLDITFCPNETIIDLRSLKRYLFSFREVLMSYERLVNVLYQDLIETYRPSQLILEMKLRPRGGLASALKVDSEWRS